ncbi:uracil-xanthine permease family protein [Embleya sp. NBC_00896]|uniref:uracil-xanthine permease family protein n=1 Tax=Embleya sp. NBC_00896 TaxID=2975961 RepID=UPI003867116C|nr:nitrate reductase [Embleya sp. NBC_00896]
MGLGLGWKLHGDGGTPGPGEVVRPDERLSWGRTTGLGAQHVVSMFGATFIAPILMGLDPNLAVMMSGVATILFLLITRGKVPSYLGSSLSFVGVAASISAAGDSIADLTGAMCVVGAVLCLVGVAIHVLGAQVVHAALPPVVTGGVVMIIGFNLAPVVAKSYWPQDQWIALLTMTFTLVAMVIMRGFWSRIAVFLGLVFGYLLSWVADLIFGKVHSADGSGTVVDHWRVNFDGVRSADWVGVPTMHSPDFKTSAILLALPVVVALIAENAGHVKAVAQMTGDDLDPQMGRAIAADGATTMLSTAVGGPATTTYAENIGVMAATRVYSTAAYYAAALFAILCGLCPKFGAIVAATPGGVLGGITVILYGMIGLLGARIWIENRIDFGNPLNLVPVAAGVVIGIGNVSLEITDDFQLDGIPLGTIVVIVAYHGLRLFAPPYLKGEAPLPDAAAVEADGEGPTKPLGH